MFEPTLASTYTIPGLIRCKSSTILRLQNSQEIQFWLNTRHPRREISLQKRSSSPTKLTESAEKLASWDTLSPSLSIPPLRRRSTQTLTLTLDEHGVPTKRQQRRPQQSSTIQPIPRPPNPNPNPLQASNLPRIPLQRRITLPTPLLERKPDLLHRRLLPRRIPRWRRQGSRRRRQGVGAGDTMKLRVNRILNESGHTGRKFGNRARGNRVDLLGFGEQYVGD